jgi:hypothetical protein
VVAVPDRAIEEVAASGAGSASTPPSPSSTPAAAAAGDALAALAARGHPVGSAHPLAALADPVTGADRLAGATWGIEGEGEALALAERLVAACGGRALHLAPGASHSTTPPRSSPPTTPSPSWPWPRG